MSVSANFTEDTETADIYFTSESEETQAQEIQPQEETEETKSQEESEETPEAEESEAEREVVIASRSLPSPDITIIVNDKQTQAVITVKNISADANIDGILIPVWGVEKKEGKEQNDIKWYTASNNGDGSWSATVDIANHKESGEYKVHIYIKYNGAQSLIGNSSFTIDAISPGMVEIIEKDEAMGTFKIKISGISSPSEITSIRVPIWSASNGQDDIIWYTAQQSGSSWYVTVDAMKHNYDTGNYYVHVYAYDDRGISNIVGSTTVTMNNMAKENLVVTLNSDETKATITLRNAKYSSATNIKFPVWGSRNGQNDIKWYSAAQISPGTWQAVISISDHKESGLYYVHAYTAINGKTQSLVSHSSFNITGIQASNVAVMEQNNERGTFKIKIDGITSPASVTDVLVPVWSYKNGQDDIRWYKAQKSGSSWYVSVDSMNHKFDVGKYNIHVYVRDNRGIQEYVGNTSLTLVAEGNPTLVMTPNSTETKVTAVLRNVPSPSNLKYMYFAVWGSKNGQNDIKWYKASQVAAGIWKFDINISNHKESGTYNVHAYKEFNDNSKSLITAGKFSITDIKCTSIQIVEKNEEYGTYKVKVSGISSPAGITKVQVPTWSSVNGQDDIKWYTAVKSGDAWYATIEAYNHNYNTGSYISHIYITDARGIQICAGSTSTNVNATKKKQGFVVENGKTYYYNSNYKRVTGWQRINGNRYYFNSNTAVMVTGWSYVDGYKYYFGTNGILLQDVRSIIGKQSSYQIKVNRQMNCVTVYARDTNGSYIIPVVSFVASAGSGSNTPTGTFRSNKLGLWWTLLGPSYGQYVTQISGNYLFHSVPYYTRGNKYSLKEHLYRKLGSKDSAGCIRLTVRDAKWIYENISNGTTIIIYDSSSAGPFDKPTALQPAYRSGYGWYDPTDPGI